jgi:hypothetical protein
MIGQRNSGLLSRFRLAALACSLFGAFAFSTVTPATASLKREVIVKYRDTGHPPLPLDWDRPDCTKVASSNGMSVFGEVTILRHCTTDARRP